MARAKRTERAEARRRYRAATSGGETNEDPIEGVAVPAAAMPRESRERKTAAPVATPARGGFLGSLRTAAAPADIRADIRALPAVLFGSKAGWIPAALVMGTAVAMLLPGLGSNQFVVLAGNVVLQPPPMIVAFLAGMLAPRGAWLMGGIMSLLAGLAFVIVVTSTTGDLATPLGFTYAVEAGQKVAYAQNVLITAPIFGIAIGAFAGFYRRFLNLSSPQREAPRRR